MKNMAMNKATVLAVLTILLGGQLAVASGTTELRQIGSLRVADWAILVYPDGSDWINPDSCTDSSVAIIQLNDPQADRKLSMLLAAFMAQQEVRLFLDGCTPAFGGTVPVVSTTILTRN